jgi:hypothetical protein
LAAQRSQKSYRHGFQSLGQGTNDGVLAFGTDGGSAESPAPVGVAQLSAAEAFGFGRASHGAFDQAAIGQKVFDGGKSVDVADLVEDVRPRLSPMPDTIWSRV